MTREEELKKKLTDDPWFKDRPLRVQVKILDYPPYYLYRLKSSGHTVELHSYTESQKADCEKCQVLVLDKHNPNLDFERRVFGIPFSDLEKLRLK